MPRSPRILTVEPGLPHHIVFRGNNRRRLFSYPRDYLSFLKDLARSLGTRRVFLHALALMSNHGHLIATPCAVGELSAFMHGLLQRYAQRRNREKGSSGKLFEERFWCEPIRDDEKLAVTTSYVDLNPERAGLGPSHTYPWTTYRLHAGHDDARLSPLWTPSTWYQNLGRTRGQRGQAYAEWTHEQRRIAQSTRAAITDPPTPSGNPRVERPDRSTAR